MLSFESLYMIGKCIDSLNCITFIQLFCCKNDKIIIAHKVKRQINHFKGCVTLYQSGYKYTSGLTVVNAHSTIYCTTVPTGCFHQHSWSSKLLNPWTICVHFVVQIHLQCRICDLLMGSTEMSELYGAFVFKAAMCLAQSLVRVLSSFHQSVSR